jgi:hypothetical protein
MSKQSIPFTATETRQGLTVWMPKPTTRYFDEFLQLKCAPDLLRLGLYPNGKELTESFAMYRAIVRLVGWHRLQDAVTLVDVGCGKQPRNAALLALRSRWSCTAIDPNLDPAWEDERMHNVRRLQCRQMRIEDYRCMADGPVVVAMVHAHVDVPTVLRSFRQEQLLLVTMPCCVPSRMDEPPAVDYYDHSCWSPQRRIYAWDFGFGARCPQRTY